MTRATRGRREMVGGPSVDPWMAWIHRWPQTRSFRASFRSGHSRSRFCKVLMPPHTQLSASSFGNGSDGVVSDWRRNRAWRFARLNFRRSLGNVAEGAMGKSGSGGNWSAQSTLSRWRTWAWSQVLVTLVCRHSEVPCEPSLAKVSARSFPGVPQWPGSIARRPTIPSLAEERPNTGHVGQTRCHRGSRSQCHQCSLVICAYQDVSGHPAC